MSHDSNNDNIQSDRVFKVLFTMFMVSIVAFCGLIIAAVAFS